MRLRVYRCMSAIIVTANKYHAAKLMEQKLKELGVEQEITEKDIVCVDRKKPGVIILNSTVIKDEVNA